MLFLLLPAAATTTRLAMLLAAASLVGATGLLVTGDTVAWCELDFQLDDFVPLLVGTVTFGR